MLCFGPRTRLTWLLTSLLVTVWPLRVWALDPNRAISQYIQTRWTTDAGLPQTSIYSIAQTTDGYIWVGTEQGLGRFDGVHFTVFSRRNVAALPANYIHRLLAGRDGSLWIGTDSGLARLKNDVWSVWTSGTGLSGEDIRALAEGSDGSLWVGTDEGLDQLRDGKVVRVLQARDGLPNDAISALLVDRSGVLWIGTHTGVASFDGSHFSVHDRHNGLAADAISAIAMGPDGTVWTGSIDGQIARIAQGVVSVEPVRLPHNDIYAMLFDREGNLWIGFQSHGLARIHDGVVTLVDAHSGLPGQTVEALIEDNEHSLWVGTFDSGLLQLRDGVFTVYGKPEGLSSNLNWCAVAAPDGSLWAGTSTGELNHRLQDGSVRVYTRADGMAGEVIHSMLLGRDGSLWLGQRHGVLTRLYRGRFTVYRDPQASGAAIDGLLEDRDGHLWVGTYGAGLARFDHGKFIHLTTAGDIPALAQSPDGALWIGSDGDGVFRMLNGETTHFTTANGLLSNHVMAIWADTGGVVYAGSNSGLDRIQNGRVTSFSPRNGLFDSTVGLIVEDNFGNLWMGSDYGVFRVAKRDLALFAEGKIADIRSVAYDTANGLRSRETMQGGTGAGSKSIDGRLWFPTMNGVAVIDPARVLGTDPPLNVRLEKLLVNGRAVPFGGRLRLQPGAERLEIQYTALSFIAPERTRFRYRLEGYEGSWGPAVSVRSAQYTNLPPGRYTFRVEAARYNGDWGPETATVSFTILPAWYRSPLALTLWCLAAFVLTWGIVALRTRSLVLRRRELERLVAERTAQLEKEKQALARAREALQIQATHDSLTGLWNRAAILEHMDREITRTLREGSVLSVILADLDHFKQINDNYGHLCGDRVLRESAQRLQAALRSYDYIGRYGGEEFLILMPGCDPAQNSSRFDDLLESIGARAFEDAGVEFRITCSFGVAVLRSSKDPPSLEQLLLLADEALYRAKVAGRNCAHYAEK